MRWFLRVGNVFVGALLRSPLHPLLSRWVVAVAVSGRRTGRRIATPVQYVEREGALYLTSRRGRRWWRNLEGGAPVELRLRGVVRRGAGEVLREPADIQAARAALAGSVLARVVDRPDTVLVRVRLEP